MLGAGTSVALIVHGMHYEPAMGEDASMYGPEIPGLIRVAPYAKEGKYRAAIDKMLKALEDVSLLPVTALGNTEMKREMALKNAQLTVKGIIALIDRLEKQGVDTTDLLKKLQTFVVGLSERSEVNQPLVGAVWKELRRLADEYKLLAGDPKYAVLYNEPYALELAQAAKARKEGRAYKSVPMPSNDPAVKISRILNAIVRAP